MFRPGKDRKYAFVLLGASAVVLALGLVFKPRPAEKKSQPSESELMQLQKLTQQRRLRDLSVYLTEAAESAASSLVFVGAARETGVVWNSAPTVVTANIPAALQNLAVTATLNGESIALHGLPLRPDAPFKAFSFAGVARPAKIASAPPYLGDWVLVAARNAQGAVVFAHGLYQGLVNARCGSFAYRAVQSSAPISTALLGGGVFSLDGRLLGIVAQCASTPIVIASESIDSTLREKPSLEARVEHKYGIKVVEEAAPTGAPDHGVVRVVALWEGSPAERAGVRPGDAILAFDGQAVHSVQDLEEPAGGSDSAQFTVQRGRKRLSLAASSDQESKPSPATYGLSLTNDPQTGRARVSAVETGSAAARAGIVIGDVLLRVGPDTVDDAPSGMSALQRKSKTPPVLTIERTGRRFEVLVQP